MRAQKHVISSSLLNRIAHADIFEIGAEPKFLLPLLGGSGVDEDEYERRSRTVIPIFDRLFEWLTRREINAVVAYVSAPYDVPFNRFAEEPAAVDTWNLHVLTELLAPWSNLPYFVSSFSGGAALAFNGLHKETQCFGGAALGADAVPPSFECPPHWTEKLRLYCAPDDLVCNHPVNRQLAQTLEDRGQAEVFQLECGRHSLVDYCTTECLGELIRFADHMAPT